MAERSFKAEVEKLRLGEGELFHGEGILACLPDRQPVRQCRLQC